MILPVRHLYGSSPEWRAIVDAHAFAFAKAERAAAIRPRISGSALRSQLRKGEINLWAVEANSDLTYFYFTTFLIRSRGCENSMTQHVGLIERHRAGGSRLKWIRAASLSCSSHSDGADIIGAVRVSDQIWFVVKGGEVDPFNYGFANYREPRTANGKPQTVYTCISVASRCPGDFWRVDSVIS